MLPATRFLYQAANCPTVGNSESVQFICWLCGTPAESGVPKALAVRDTFMDIDKARNPQSLYVCTACAWCFSDRDETLTKRVGSFWRTEEEALAANLERIETWQKKIKASTQTLPSANEVGIDKIWGGYAIPQRMRTYSHFVMRGVWSPLTKAEKKTMRALLFAAPENESWLAAIANTGQKHIIFRATVAQGENAVVQFEEQRMTYKRAEICALYDLTQQLYTMGFSKDEIESGEYARTRLSKCDLSAWRRIENQIKHQRNTAALQLAIFLTQKEDSEQ